MTVDPTDPDEIGTETPEDDAAEQRAEAVPADRDEDDASADGRPAADPAEADEGDAVEQARAVTLDEDEYR
ncbi:hypothetical protein [Streptomyces liangshanensis]|uniref:Uncharacterized protein n=1 Tax=Streptomyces liangshanensis TaxID=2717324 RepID=A0A6G9GX72_9ACTN|nr:hypothetical protein [Streptomyces liangshanensis]QIQ02810.1 hypothetical protein HA039_11195 [Streptomyces liangshanensis]